MADHNPEPGERIYLTCKREGKITLHRFEGPMIKYFTPDIPKDIYRRFKDKQLFTCLSCLSTFTWDKADIAKLTWEDSI